MSVHCFNVVIFFTFLCCPLVGRSVGLSVGLSVRLCPPVSVNLSMCLSFKVSFISIKYFKGRKVKSDHRSKFSNLSNWKEEA